MPVEQPAGAAAFTSGQFSSSYEKANSDQSADLQWNVQLKHLPSRAAGICKQEVKINYHKFRCQTDKVCPDRLVLWQRNIVTADEETPASLSDPMLPQPGTPGTLGLSLRLLLPTASTTTRARLKSVPVFSEFLADQQLSPLLHSLQEACNQAVYRAATQIAFH